MPHAALTLIPGVDTNKTEALNEAAISSSNLVRFMPDRQGNAMPQKIGGWEKFFFQNMGSEVRELWAWADTNSDNHMAVGTKDYLFTLKDNVLTDRSPQYYDYSATVSFTTAVNDSKVIVTDTGSNINSTDNVFIQTPISVGGIILFGLYSCTASTANTYEITSTNVLGNPLAATSSVTNGGATPIFDAISGQSEITVTLPNHGYSVDSDFAVLVPVTVGGITLDIGNYTIQRVPGVNTFIILAQNAATSTSTTNMNGGKVLFRYYLGRKSTPSGSGYGSGGYGSGGYGSGVTVGSGRQFATTAVSSVGTTATVSFGSDFSVPVGSQVVIAGVTPTGYNGTWTVTASTSGGTSTVSFTTPTVLSGPMTVAGTATFTQYDVSPWADWTLDNWGGELISCPQEEAIYSWSHVDGGAGSSILPNAPVVNRGAFVAMPQRQIFAYGSTFNGIQDPLLVRWCDVNKYSSWIATPTNQAGSYRLSNGSRIVGGMQAAGQNLFWTDIGLWSAQYVGPPYVYGFNEVAKGCGLVGKKAAGAIAGGVYWMSQSQFFRIAGGGPEVVPCSLWDVIFQDIDLDYADNIRAAPNSRFGEVTWFYPVVGSAGVPTKYVKYNIITDQWDFGEMTRTAWIDQSVYGPPIAAGGDNYIYQHETTNDADGSAMNAFIQTGYFAIAEGDQLWFVDQMWPDMKWGDYPINNGAEVKISFYCAEYPGETPRVYGPFVVTKDTKFITPRFRTRLMAIRVESDDVGSFWRLGKIRYRFSGDGKFL